MLIHEFLGSLNVSLFLMTVTILINYLTDTYLFHSSELFKKEGSLYEPFSFSSFFYGTFTVTFDLSYSFPISGTFDI